ncbi:HalOD1 output domain-containing protein [Natrinema sp. SYSU A 869]|uniref:HalOD1 output domain-containing protein n=1 Tax=Natrinema sp. SYSU A 869 TaxID=2871694 RepID=UPI001CA3C6F6|nr:HalOD1 output domain-containing protein [Natrinema sp. SYSU A 869]
MNDFQYHDDCRADGGTPFVTERKLDETMVEAIIRSIATITGVDETDLEPLYDTVEVDALAEIVTHAEQRDRSVSVSFGYEGHTVVVDGAGSIRIVDDPPRKPSVGSDR